LACIGVEEIRIHDNLKVPASDKEACHKAPNLELENLRKKEEERVHRYDASVGERGHNHGGSRDGTEGESALCRAHFGG